MRHWFRFFASIVIVFSVLAGGSLLHAQSSNDVERQRAQFEAELRQLEAEIEAQQVILDQKRREGSSVERDLAILNAQIEAARLKIRERNLAISNLGDAIQGKTQTISELDQKLSRSKDSLAQLIRKTNEIDDFSLVEIILGKQELSDFFEDIDSFDAIKRSMQTSFQEIRGIQVQAGEERSQLTAAQRAEIDARAVVESQKRNIEYAEDEKKDILNAIEEEAQTYEQVIAVREQEAARIRSALFALRDSAAIPFGEALDLANAAAERTGVRPAFILAILQQESDFGENIGSCYLRNTETGAGVGKNTGRVFNKVMKPTRDVEPFLAVTKKLGRDPFTTPVSCPWSGGGYGGAMGPSQFIPSTWRIFEDRIAKAVGVRTADPWIPQHAIMATAIFLSDLGADRGGYSAEINAACRYYSGRMCDNKRPANTFYGESVVKKAQNIQENMIDPLQRF